MAYLNDLAFDSGLAWVTANGSRIDICSSEPSTYSEATTTYTLGNKTGLTVGAAEDGDTDGRKVVVPAFSGGTVTATGTAAYWALTDGAGILLATRALAATQPVTAGNTFNLGALDITIRDATAV